MFETAGNLTVVEIASSLVALVLLPLLWAGVAALAAVRLRGGALATRAAIALSAGTLGLAVVHAARATQLPQGRVAEQHVAQIARIGQLDLGIDLVRDPTSASLAVLVSFVAFCAVVQTVWSSTANVTSRLGWTGLASSAALVVVLADNLPTLAVGLQLATLAAWGLGPSGRARALGFALAGDVSALFAAWILFWSLGGTFSTSGYMPDSQPRFAIVAVPDTADRPKEGPDAKSVVSLSTYPDALVSSDDGPPLPGEPLRSPFTLTLDPGVYSFRIQAGVSTSDLLVTHVALAPGHSYVLTPYGPTTSFRNLGDQLTVPRPALSGPSSMRSVLASRSIAGVGVATLVALVLVLAALLRLALLVRSAGADAGARAPTGIAYALDALPPVVLALRIAPILDAGAATTLAAASALVAVVLAADAAAASSRDRAARAVLGGLVGLAVTSVLLGETAGALVIVGAGMLGAAGATVVIESAADVRWLGVACASTAGILPGAGVSPGIAATIASAFGAAAAGRGAGALVGLLVVAAAMLLSLAAFRVYGASIRGGSEHPSRGASVLVVILASASLLGGAALGVGTSPFGGHTLPLARRLVAPPGGADDSVRFAALGVAVSLGAAVLGLILARRATRESEPPKWVGILAAPGALVVWGAAGAARLLRFFVQSVAVMNEDVVEDATDVLASGVLAVAAGLRRLEARIGGGRAHDAARPARGAGALVLGAGMDDPARAARAERLRTGLVLGMVGILGLVVLCSVLLG